jgi:hypothetical protein
MGKKMDILIQEEQWNPNSMNAAKSLVKHIVTKLLKVKDVPDTRGSYLSF